MTIHSTLISYYFFNITRKSNPIQSFLIKSCTLIDSLFAVHFCTVGVCCTITLIMSHTDLNPICDEIIDNFNYIDLSDISSLSRSDTDLLVMQLNIRGLISKQDSLKHLLSEFKILPDLVQLCETWLKKVTENKVDIPGYKCYHKHGLDRFGGGVSVLVKNALRSRVHTDLITPMNFFEFNVVELKTNKNNILLVSGYRPPNSNPKAFMKEYKNVLTRLMNQKQTHHDLIVGMDHNFDLLKSANNNTTSKFLDLNLDRGLTPV